ncbi:hypothetical protein [Kibdelosporangium philippinense]|uniref:hypothetical protein n=1 Tax=Kibdelosporangium philippinense TaxID=211113 RepID=UPI00360F8CC0
MIPDAGGWPRHIPFWGIAGQPRRPGSLIGRIDSDVAAPDEWNEQLSVTAELPVSMAFQCSSHCQPTGAAPSDRDHRPAARLLPLYP